MHRLGVDNCEDEVSTITYSLPSLSDIISAEHEVLQDVPISISILNAIEEFFSFDTSNAYVNGIDDM